MQIEEQVHMYLSMHQTETALLQCQIMAEAIGCSLCGFRTEVKHANCCSYDCGLTSTLDGFFVAVILTIKSLRIAKFPDFT